MNAFKKTGGFTLVELIIVIAILAILSSVAVVGYSAYIDRANKTATNAYKSEIQAAATLANAEKGEVTAEFEIAADGKLLITFVATNGYDDDFATLFSVKNLTLVKAEANNTYGVAVGTYYATTTVPNGWVEG